MSASPAEIRQSPVSHYALETYDQIRVALQRIDESGASDLPELPSRFQDDAEDDPVQP